METIGQIWNFVQDEVLGMAWLHRLISGGLEAWRLSTDGRLGGSVLFFLYDTVKIFILLTVLIWTISYLQSYFPPERARRILGHFHGIGASCVAALLGTGNPLGVVVATIAGIPMYADIFGTIPVAEALLSKGARLGVVLSFMMGVTTLSLPSVILLRKAVKPRLLAVFVGICTGGIILVGYFFNAVQNLLM